MRDGKGLRKQASFFDRRRFGIKLNAIMALNSTITITRILCLKMVSGLYDAAFGFENGKSIFHHGIVVWAGLSGEGRRNAVSCIVKVKLL